MGMSARTEDNIEKISDAIEMNTKAIAGLNKNLFEICKELKDMKIEQMAIRRNTSYLKSLKVQILK